MSKADQTKCNTIYLTTSPNVSVVKVGVWSRDAKTLLSRYFTYYGTDTSCIVFNSNTNKRDLERKFQVFFISSRISSEVFKKHNMDEYINFLENETNTVPIRYTCHSRERKIKYYKEKKEDIEISEEELISKKKFNDLMMNVCKKLGLENNNDTVTVIPHENVVDILNDQVLLDQILMSTKQLRKIDLRVKIDGNIIQVGQLIRILSALFIKWMNFRLKIVYNKKHRIGQSRRIVHYKCKLEKIEK